MRRFLTLFVLAGLVWWVGSAEREVRGLRAELSRVGAERDAALAVECPTSAPESVCDVAIVARETCPTCKPCARRTRPAASDAWIEHAAREWRLAEAPR